MIAANTTRSTAALRQSPVGRAVRAVAPAPMDPQVWRQGILDLANELVTLLAAAEDLGESGDSVARILTHAEGELHVWITVVQVEDPTDQSASMWLEWFFDIEAHIEAAAALMNDAAARGAVIRAALATCAALAARMDTPPLPKIDRATYYQQQFMRGKARFADLLDQARATEADNDLEAQHRPRDVRQNTRAVDACLNQLRFDYGAQEGFSAALTGSISIGSSFSLPSSDLIRDLTYEECIGGPDTVYADEEEGDADGAADTMPQTDIPAWRITAHDVEQELLGIIEGCRNMDITEGDTACAFTLLDLASDILADNCEMRRTGSADDYYGDCINQVQALLRGAADMTNTSSAMRTIAGVLLQKVDALAKVLDTADIQVKHETLQAHVAEEGTQQPNANAVDSDSPEPVFTDPFEQRTDDLLENIEMYMEGLEHIGVGEKAYSDLNKLASPHYWEARNLLNNHSTADRIVAEILALRDGLELLAAWMAPDPGVPLVRECVTLINTYLGHSGDDSSGGSGASVGPEGDPRPTTDRLETVRQAGAFISRVVDKFRDGEHQPAPQDWAALHEAASVVMSGASDEVETGDSLTQRLDDAIDSASLLLQDQLPRHFLEGGALRAKDAGKLIVAATE
jgi:hypothetical protein